MSPKLIVYYLVLGSMLFGMHSAVADLRREMDAPFAVAGPALGAVRGKLVRVGRDGRQYPAAGILVRLNHPRLGPSAPAYSGADGFFYLYQIPSDVYTLEVWLNREQVLRFQIRVNPSTPQQPFTDIAPIRVP